MVSTVSFISTFYGQFGVNVGERESFEVGKGLRFGPLHTLRGGARYVYVRGCCGAVAKVEEDLG